MFWRYNALTSHIDTLLEKENVTIHELMDEDDILQECKGQNHKLIDFLIMPEVMEELVKLITCEPSEDVEDKVRYKYPNIACELLTSDVSQILDKLIEENVFIDKIYSFLLSNDQLNPLLASFFTKVLGLLLVRKADYLFEYLTSKDDFLGNLLSHLGTSAIMDLLMRLVTYDPMYETKAKIVKWMDEADLVEKLVNLIHTDQSEEMHCNAAMALCDIIKFGREQLGTEVPQPDPLLDKLERDPVLSDLLRHMLECSVKNESVITNGLLVLQTTLEYRRQISSFDDWRPLPDGCVEPLPQSEITRMEQAVTCVLKSVKPKIGLLANLLTDPPRQSQHRMCLTTGVLEPPLGNTRLQVSRLFATLFEVEDSDLHLCLIENNVINKLLDLFFHYVWNNFLHTQMEISISNILAKRGSSGEEDSPRSLQDQEVENTTPTTVNQDEDIPLVTHLFKDCRIIGRMLEAWEGNEEAIKSGQQRRGYMGHVTKICNDIVEASEKGSYAVLVKSLLDELPTDIGDRWTQLVSSQLADTNQKNMSDLVGGRPFHSSSGSDSDSDFKDIPFPQDDSMQQAFSDYQMQQLTSTFIDQFGLTDEEFGQPTERIESAFTQQISSLDWSTNTTEKQPKEFEDVCEMEGGGDSDGEEEDLWKNREIMFSANESTGSSKGFSANTSNVSAAPAGSDSDDSSDDELSSPTIIKSRVDPSMEVDHSTMTAGPVAPIAMDTSPWETAATKSGGDDEEWTAFEGAEEEATSSGDGAGWADFSNLDCAPATDGGPRVSSPEALVESPQKLSSSVVDNNTQTSANNSQSNNDRSNDTIEHAPSSDISSCDTTANKNTSEEITVTSNVEHIVDNSIARDADDAAPKPKSVSMEVDELEVTGGLLKSPSSPGAPDIKQTGSLPMSDPDSSPTSAPDSSSGSAVSSAKAEGNLAAAGSAAAPASATSATSTDIPVETPTDVVTAATEPAVAAASGNDIKGSGDSPKCEKPDIVNGPLQSSDDASSGNTNGPV